MGSLMKYLKKYRIEAVMAPLFKMLEASFELFVPLVMAKIIDIGIRNGDLPYILSLIHICSFRRKTDMKLCIDTAPCKV